MNNSIAENMVEKINYKTIHETSKHNDTFSHFKGSVEVNKFNNMNTNRFSSDKLLNNEEINFSKANHKISRENKDSDLNRSVILKGARNMRLSNDHYKINKNLSLEIMKTMSNKIDSAKKEVKSVRSKKFLIPIDPNLYRVDMEEVIKKFNGGIQSKKRQLESLNSSKMNLDKAEIITNLSSKNEEKSLNVQKNNDSTKNNTEYENLLTNNTNTIINNKLLENLKYLRLVSDNKEPNIEKVKDKQMELSIISENKEKAEDLLIGETALEINYNPDEFKIIGKETKEINKPEQIDLKTIENEKGKSKDEIKITNKPKSLSKIKEMKAIKNIKKNTPPVKPNLDQALKLAKNKLNIISTVANTPTKKAITSKVNLKIINKKSPEKEITAELNKNLENNIKASPNPAIVNKSRPNSAEKPSVNTKISNKSLIFDSNENHENYCFYCIKKLISPVSLTCKHKICYECAVEIHYLNEFAKFEVY